jgi:hypothetical protein
MSVGPIVLNLWQYIIERAHRREKPFTSWQPVMKKRTRKKQGSLLKIHPQMT